MDLRKVQTQAEAHGLIYLGISALDSSSESFQNYQKWISDRYHADMSYMEKHTELRKSPSLLLPNAKSAFIFGFPYYQVEKNQNPKAALYARFQDYHKLFKKLILLF